MIDFLNNLYSNSSFPALSALFLGLMTAISPCPLATNITAIAFVSKDINNKKKVMYNGLIYTLGRVISYTLLAFILFLGADQFKISGLFQQYGEKILGPLLLIIGLVMLNIIKFNFGGFSKFGNRFQNKEKHSYWDVLLLGIVFALAFCPYSGILYFGMLIPMTIDSVSHLYLPVIFAMATAIPVIVFTWLFAYSSNGVSKLYTKIKSFEIWFRRVIAIVFILVGIYYIIQLFI